MKRKVIKLAEKTFVISLPSQWVKKYGIVKSDELDVVEKHNTLMVSTGADVTVPQKTTVDLSGLSKDFTKSIISVLHKVGYDEIEFIYDDPAILPVIHERTTELIGFEVIEQTPKRCTIKNVSGDLNHELDNMVRRTFLVTLSLGKGIHEALVAGRYEQLTDLLHLEKTSNRLTNYCHRLLNKQSRGPHSIFLYLVLWTLESIADDFRDVCLLLNKQREDLSRPALVLLKDVVLHFENYYKHFFDGTVGNMEELRKENVLLRKDLRKVVASTLTEQTFLSYIHSLLQRTYDCFGSTTGQKFLQEHARSGK